MSTSSRSDLGCAISRWTLLEVQSGYVPAELTAVLAGDLDTEDSLPLVGKVA